MLCDEVRPRLDEYIAEMVAMRNAGTWRGDEALERHLAECAACRAEAERLRCVEEALWRYPGVTPPATLTADVMRRVAEERQAVEEEWRVLPWDVWVPAVAFLLALLVAVASIPPHLLPTMSGDAIGGTVASWSEQVNGWLAPIQGPAQGGLLWSVLPAILATTAGVGLAVALSAWPSDELSAVESRVTDAASRLWNLARRAH